MISNKKIATLGASAAVLGAGLLGGSVMAATNTNSTTDNNYPPIVQKIADRFHLNKTDVQKVFDEEKTARQQARDEKLKSRLDVLVKDGSLTQDQEDKIIAKLKELRDTAKTENQADRKSNREQFRSQMQQWLADNGITLDLSQVMPGPGGHMHHQD